MITSQRGMTLVEVLVSVSLLTSCSLFLLKANLQSLQSLRDTVKQSEVRRGLVNRLEIEKATEAQQNVEFVELAGVEFITERKTAEHLGQNALVVTVSASWLDEKGETQHRSLTSWVKLE